MPSWLIVLQSGGIVLHVGKIAAYPSPTFANLITKFTPFCPPNSLLKCHLSISGAMCRYSISAKAAMATWGELSQCRTKLWSLENLVLPLTTANCVPSPPHLCSIMSSVHIKLAKSYNNHWQRASHMPTYWHMNCKSVNKVAITPTGKSTTTPSLHWNAHQLITHIKIWFASPWLLRYMTPISGRGK